MPSLEQTFLPIISDVPTTKNHKHKTNNTRQEICMQSWMMLAIIKKQHLHDMQHYHLILHEQKQKKKLQTSKINIPADA